MSDYKQSRGGIIAIVYGAILNQNKIPGRGGWIPQVWEDGRATRSTWKERSLDLDEAEREACTLANELAARYIGDWKISITKASAA